MNTAAALEPIRLTRADAIESAGQAQLVARLVRVSAAGLSHGFDRRTARFAQTIRGITGSGGVAVRAEGNSLRYTAIAALGIGRLTRDEQARILGDIELVDLLLANAKAARRHDDPGALALSMWALAESCGRYEQGIVGELVDVIQNSAARETVWVAWALTAAEAAANLGPADDLAERAAELLLSSRGSSGLFPHVAPASGQLPLRRHVGSFADQIYPVQALSRHYARTGNPAFLAAAELTADRLCAAQGSAGQWRWHYDIRTGGVVETYPTYSVHQHSMAPMALMELSEAGGSDRFEHVRRGLGWLENHPEVVEELVSERWGLIWRKVGRREPRKLARSMAAVSSAVRPGMRLKALDRLLPTTIVDHECRPYELGWLLYAWLPGEPIR